MKAKQKLIYTSTDYSKFIKDESNRATGNNKILKASLKNYGWLPEHPAIVIPDGGKFRIIDGQHRFVYAKELGLPVCYTLGSRTDIPIADTNNTQRRWSLRDYVTSYAGQGKKDYQRLIDFSNETGLSLVACTALLVGSGDCKSARDGVKRGSFKVRDEQHARNVIAVLQCASQFVPWTKNTFFVSAVSQVLLYSAAKVEVLCAKIRSHGGKLILCPTTEHFVEMLENIYNSNARQLTSISLAVRQSIREKKANARK
jgi:hypothetical protein